jgi:hypothetical protein
VRWRERANGVMAMLNDDADDRIDEDTYSHSISLVVLLFHFVLRVRVLVSRSDSVRSQTGDRIVVTLTVDILFYSVVPSSMTTRSILETKRQRVDLREWTMHIEPIDPTPTKSTSSTVAVATAKSTTSATTTNVSATLNTTSIHNNCVVATTSTAKTSAATTTTTTTTAATATNSSTSSESRYPQQPQQQSNIVVLQFQDNYSTYIVLFPQFLAFTMFSVL